MLRCHFVCCFFQRTSLPFSSCRCAPFDSFLTVFFDGFFCRQRGFSLRIRKSRLCFIVISCPSFKIAKVFKSLLLTHSKKSIPSPMLPFIFLRIGSDITDLQHLSVSLPQVSHRRCCRYRSRCTPKASHNQTQPSVTHIQNPCLSPLRGGGGGVCAPRVHIWTTSLWPFSCSSTQSACACM